MQIIFYSCLFFTHKKPYQKTGKALINKVNNAIRKKSLAI